MFFDADFNPTSYVDALFLSMVNNGASSLPNNTYTRENLVNIGNKSLSLVTHLDYYTNELSQELSGQLSALKTASNYVVSVSEEADLQKTEESNITRLQYYVNALGNAVDSLNSDLAKLDQKQPLLSENGASRPIQNLVQFRTVKARLQGVLGLFQKLEVALESPSSDSITVGEFQTQINELYDTVKTGLANNPSDTKVKETIDDLVALLPVFKGLSQFYPVYKKFVGRLEADREKVK